MVVKFLIALCISIAVMSLGYRGTDSINKALISKDQETRAVLLDTAIMKYYYYHHGTLPTSLDKDTLKVMGLENMDLSGFQYTHSGNTKFVIRYLPASGPTASGYALSPNSNKTLVPPPEVN